MKRILFTVFAFILFTTAVSARPASPVTSSFSDSVITATLSVPVLNAVFADESHPVINSSYSWWSAFLDWLHRLFGGGHYGGGNGGSDGNPGDAVSVGEAIALGMLLLALCSIGLIWLRRSRQHKS